MFTGLIREIGTILRRDHAGASLAVACPGLRPQLAIGDSIAVNGVCLTARSLLPEGFIADLSPETANRSTLSRLSNGSRVNLEAALAVGDRLGGHIVQGHVDGIGRCVRISPAGDGWEMEFESPRESARYIAGKGSVALDGVSLTVASVSGNRFTVAVIPHTFSGTTLQYLRAGELVNLEVDILAKYVERLLRADREAPVITEEFLRRHGFES